jgi:hypothetical protein
MDFGIAAMGRPALASCFVDEIDQAASLILGLLERMASRTLGPPRSRSETATRCNL